MSRVTVIVEIATWDDMSEAEVEAFVGTAIRERDMSARFEEVTTSIPIMLGAS
jgi:hypothetical protein